MLRSETNTCDMVKYDPNKPLLHQKWPCLGKPSHTGCCPVDTIQVHMTQVDCPYISYDPSQFEFLLPLLQKTTQWNSCQCCLSVF